MGQLEPFGINEIILSSMMSSFLNSYVAEDESSDDLESLKAYFYSAALALSSRKSRPLELKPLQIITNDGGSLSSWTFLSYITPELRMTKIIDNFPIWQDPKLSDADIDELMVSMHKRFSW